MVRAGKMLIATSGCSFLLATQLLVLAPRQADAVDGYCSACSCSGDRDGDGAVTIDEVVEVVNNLLQGCPALSWQRGCGPPIYGTDECPETTQFCTTEQVGAPCDAPAECCTSDSHCLGTLCNAPLVCAARAPTRCPISRRAYKRDIEYLDARDIAALRQQLLAFKLARYRYQGEGGSAPDHLGFIIDDIEPSPAVGTRGDTVDLYGYLSMAVATIQVQSDDIDKLRREISDLRQQVNRLKRPSQNNQGASSRIKLQR